jgi:phytoene desaturase
MPILRRRCSGWFRIGLRRAGRNERIAKKQFSCSTFMMYLGIEGSYDDVAHHTIYLSKELSAESAGYRAGSQSDIGRSQLLCAECLRDRRTLAPKGMSTLYVLVPVTHEHAAM